MPAESQDSCHLSSEWLKRSPPNEVDTLVVRVKPPGTHPMSDSAPAEPGLHELLVDCEPLLNVRDPRDLPVAPPENVL